MRAICPKCGWTTRELDDDECDMVKQGRYRCSGACQDAAVPNAPNTFPPRLRLEEKQHIEEGEK